VDLLGVYQIRDGWFNMRCLFTLEDSRYHCGQFS